MDLNKNPYNVYTIESRATLDQALSQIGFGKFNYIVILLTGTALGCVFLETVCINVLLPLAQCDLNLTTEDKSMLSSIAFFGIILSSHLWGFLADTKGRRKVIIPTLLIAAVLSLISSFAKSFWVLLFLRFLNGIFISGPSATVYAYVCEFHSVQMRSRVMMFTSVVFGVACLWYPATSSILLNQEWSYKIEFLDLTFKPWRLYFIIASIPTVFCAILMMIYVPESPKYTFTQGNEDKTLQILQRAHYRNTGKSNFRIRTLIKDDEFGEGLRNKNNNFLKFMWKQTKPLFQHPHLKNTLRACFIQFAIFSSSNGFWVFFPEIANGIGLWQSKENPPATLCEIFYSTRSMHKSVNETISDVEIQHCLTKLEPSTFISMLCLNSIYIGGWVLLSFLINKIGKLISINSVFTICLVCAIMLTFTTNSYISNVNYIILLAVGVAITVLNASTAELFPTQYRAMALSLSLMCGRLGGVLGSLFIGFIMDQYCVFTFSMPIVLFVISICLTFTIPNIGRRS